MMKQSKPRSRILSLILAGALAVSLLPFSAATAFADSGEPTDSNAPAAFAAAPAEENRTLFFKDGKLYIGELVYGQPPQALTEYYVGQEGKWSVNGDTLTLNGFTFETAATKCLWVMDDAKLVLADGSVNTFTASGEYGTAWYFQSERVNGDVPPIDVDISGGGTLKLTGVSDAIRVAGNATVSDVTIEAAGGGRVIEVPYSGTSKEPIGNTMTITNSNITVTGTGDYSRGFYFDMECVLNIENSTVTAKSGGAAMLANGGINVDEGLAILGTADGNEPAVGNAAVVSTAKEFIVVGDDPDGTTQATWVKIYPDKEKVEITAAAATGLVYNGQPQTGVTNVSVSDDLVPVSDLVATYAGKGDTEYSGTTAPKDAGDYTVTLSVAAEDETYMGKSAPIDFSIAKKSVTVKPKDFSIAPGTALPTFALDFEGIVGTETLTVTPAPTFECKKDGVPVDGKTAGTYDIVWNEYGTTTFTGDENYIVAKQEKGTLTVETPRTNSPSSGGGKSSWTPTTSANVIDVPEGNLGLGTYNNYDKLLVQGLEKLVEQNKGKTVNFDTVENGKVLYRIKLDPAKLAGVLKNDLSLSAHIGQNDAAVLEVTNRFAKYYGNNIVAITYAQAKPLGVSAEFAARLDLSKLNTKTLYFYSYDNTTNTYARIAAPNYFVDANGYSHITAPLGGSIIITDKPLASK